MKPLGYIGIALLAVSIAGCTNPRAKLTNTYGQTIECSASGFGLITGAIAKQQYKDCVRNAQRKGYRIVEAD